jgi:hypothetical protein
MNDDYQMIITRKVKKNPIELKVSETISFEQLHSTIVVLYSAVKIANMLVVYLSLLVHL